MVCSNCGGEEFTEVGSDIFKCDNCDNLVDEEGYEI